MGEDDEKLVLALACNWRALEPDARSSVVTALDERALTCDEMGEANAARVAAELLRALSSS